MLTVRIHNLGQIAMLRCSGRLVLGEQTDLLRTAVISQATKRIVVLDFATVNAIDASGAGLLVSLHDWTRANGVEMKLMNAVCDIHHLTALWAHGDSDFNFYWPVEREGELTREELIEAAVFPATQLTEEIIAVADHIAVWDKNGKLAKYARDCPNFASPPPPTADVS